MNSLNMDLAHSLCLNIDVLEKLPEHKKSIFLNEWLRFLDKVLPVAQKADIKDKQDLILENLLGQLTTTTGFAARHNLSISITTIFMVGDTSKLFDVMNRLTDVIKTNDSSAAFISRRLAAICCLGIICQRLGRMVGRSYDGAVQCLIKGYKTAESQTRCESLIAFGRIICGLGNVAANVQRDILKLARAGLADRVVPVRLAAVACLKVMAEGLPYVPPGANTDLDVIVQQCSKVVILEPGTAGGAVGSICCGFADLQRSTADLVAYLIREAGVQPTFSMAKSVASTSKNPQLSPDDALLMLGNLFTRGSASSAVSVLRSTAADLMGGSRTVSVCHEVRYAVAHAYVEFIRLLGSRWLCQHLPQFLDHISMVCAGATRSVFNGGESPHQQHVDLLAVRRCILHILSSTTGLMLSENAQLAALLHLSQYILRHISISKNEISPDGAASQGDAMVDSAIVMVVSPTNTVPSQTQGANSSGGNSGTEVPAAKHHQEQEQHLVHTVVCSLLHMSSLTTLVGDAIVSNPALFSLANRQSPILEALFASLAHSSNSVRTAACLCLRSIGLAYPPALAHLLDRCANVLRDSHDVQLTPEVIFGFGTAIATLIAAAAAPDETPRNVSTGSGDVTSTAVYGLSPNTIRRMFDLAVHMLHCVPLTLRLSEARASVAYLILGAIVRHSPLAVRPLLPRLLALCLRVFPRSTPPTSSTDEAANQANGNAFTWQVMMEARTVVLYVLEILVTRWPYIFPSTAEATQSSTGTTSTDLYLKLLALVHRAVVFVDQLPSISKTHGNSVKISAAAYRSRLYSLLHTVLQSPTNGTPSTAVSGLVSSPASLLREAVADLTLVDPVGYTTASSAPLLFATLGQHHLNLLLTLGPASSMVLDFPLSIEHDPSLLISQSIDPPSLVTSVWQIGQVPRSTNLVCNAARLLAVMLTSIPAKHRLQIVSHFGEAIRQAKAGQLRQQAIQCNLLSVLLLYFRNTSSNNTPYPADWLTSVTTLIHEAIDSRVPLIRSAGAEALGRLAAAVGDPRYAADLRQTTTDRLRSSRDMNTRICQSLALGAILCQCGANQTGGGVLSLPALQHCIGLLLGLAQDHTATSVQAAALHALAVTLDANGPLVRSYAESLVTLIVSVLLHALGTSGCVQGSSHLPQLAARCLNAIITTLGPELAANTSVMDEARSCILTALSALMTTERGAKLSPESAYAQAEALACYQQLHLYAPRHVSLLTLVPKLFDILHVTQQQIDALDDWSSCVAVTVRSSPLVVVRRAAAGCLRQLAQREPSDLIEHTIRLSGDSGKLELESQLFALLDVETDAQLRSDIHEALISLLQTVGTARLSVWLLLIRDVLSKTSTENTAQAPGSGGPSKSASHRASKQQQISKSSAKKTKGGLADEDEEEEETDEEEGAHFGPVVAEDPNPPLLPRWRSRVFAVNCLTRLIDSCHSTGDPRHFDLNLARSAGGNCWLVLHLPDIVRLVSLAATHPCLNVRLAGLSAMRSMICHFAESQDPELPSGSSLLEQYQAQMGASLRPAFAADAPAYITADACDVCSAWLASGITREPADLMRIHILLVGMLNRLDQGNSNNSGDKGKQAAPIGYTQAAEMFGVLRAWAEVYVEADSREQQRIGAAATNAVTFNDGDSDSMDEGATNSGESLVGLVAPNLELLGPLWLHVLRDYALLSFVGASAIQTDARSPNGNQQSTGSGFFALSHLTENLDPPDARRLCIAAFPAVVQAASLWLISVNSSTSPLPDNTSPSAGDSSLLLLLGACAGTLCERLNIDPPATLIACLRSLTRLFSSNWAANRFAEDFVVVRELLQITYRLLLVRELTQILQPSVVGLATAISKSLAVCFTRLPTMSSFSSTPPSMTASPSLLGLSLVGSKADMSPSTYQQHPTNVPFSGDVVVAERVLLAIAHRVLLPQQSTATQNHAEAATLAVSVLELLGSLPSLTLCHPTTTPSIFALISRAINSASFHTDFPRNVVPVLASTVSHLVSTLSDHNSDEAPPPLSGVMIWRLVEQILTNLVNNSEISAASSSVILIDCVLIPLSVPCPAGSSKYSETQFEQLSRLSVDVVNKCLNSDRAADCMVGLAALRRLVMSIDLTASPRGGSPFAAELIAAVVSASMHSLCAIVLEGGMNERARSATFPSTDNTKNVTSPTNLLSSTVALIRAIIEFLSLSGTKNRTELLEIAFHLFARAALIHGQSPETKLMVPILSDCISALATANPTEFRTITAQSPSLRQQLHEVLTAGSASAQASSNGRQLDSSSLKDASSASQKISLKINFAAFSSKETTPNPSGADAAPITTEKNEEVSLDNNAEEDDEFGEPQSARAVVEGNSNSDNNNNNNEASSMDNNNDNDGSKGNTNQGVVESDEDEDFDDGIEPPPSGYRDLTCVTVSYDDEPE